MKCMKCMRGTYALTLLVALLLNASSLAQTIVFVDDDAANNGNGESWTTAFNTFQDGLDAARDLAQTGPVQVWIAAGTYRPDQGAGITLGSRSATFTLANHVGIYGGFAGNETATTAGFNSRNPIGNPTILSGDLAGNDVISLDQNGRYIFTNYDDNSYHVVTAPNLHPGELDQTAILNGVTIRSGNSFGGPELMPGMEASMGAGIIMLFSQPSIIRCTIERNLAKYGAGVAMRANPGKDPNVINCTFMTNLATSRGGAWYVHRKELVQFATSGGPELINCLVRDNQSQGEAGALYAEITTGATFTNCTIVRNLCGTASAAGGVFHENTSTIRSVRAAALMSTTPSRTSTTGCSCTGAVA